MTIIKFIYAEGTCILKNPKTIRKGRINQKILLLVFKARKKIIKETTEKINEC